MLFFTGFSRIASVVAKAQIDNLDNRQAELRQMRCMVDDGSAILSSAADIRGIGELLHSAWEYKRSLSAQVSNAQIDELYARARRAGAIGGKLLGAGGGGFMLLFVEPAKQEAVRATLADHIHVPFQFETAGSEIVYYQP
jgi:D-glycero-alpha-D-manno-heptose-7-phosphate kinase